MAAAALAQFSSTQPGKILRLRGKGLPSTDGSGTGDELVNVMVYVPENLSDDEKKTIEELKDKPNMVPTESVKNRIFSKLRHIFDWFDKLYKRARFLKRTFFVAIYDLAAESYEFNYEYLYLTLIQSKSVTIQFLRWIVNQKK